MTAISRLSIPFTAEELRRVTAVAAECGDAPVEYIRSITLATCTPRLYGASMKRPGPRPAKEKAPKANCPGLIVVDETQKPVKCGGCGEETVRAKSKVAERHYSVLYAGIDWSQKPPTAMRHLCVGAK